MSSPKKVDVSKVAPVSSIGTNMKEATVETGTAVKSLFARIVQFIKNKPLVVITGLIITVLIGIIVAWLIYKYIKTKALEHRSYLLEETKYPLSGLTLNKCDGSKIPDTANGKRFSLSFWIYIHNLDKNSGMLRHVLHRGDERNPMAGSPGVLLDANSNKLYIIFDTTERNPGDPADLASKSADIQLQYAVARRGITVDYVPLQRWVHITVVVNEDANGGSIASYVDGELVKTVTSNKSVTVGTYTVTPKISNLALDRKGTIFVGGTNDAASGIGFSGLVGMTEFFNYNLNAKDVYETYIRGPIHVSAMGKFANSIGIGGLTNQYGVRNPIYKKPVINV